MEIKQNMWVKKILKINEMSDLKDQSGVWFESEINDFNKLVT